jgi:hypothetical protein
MTESGQPRIDIALPEPIALPDGSGRAVTMPAGVFVPGASFTAPVWISWPDEKTRSARVEFGYLNTYTRYVRDSDGHRRRRRVTSWVRVHLHRIPATHGQHPVRFEIPRTAPPTVTDMVQWQVRATLDREHGFDRTAELSVIVLTVRGMHDHAPADPPVLAPGIMMWLELYGPPHLHRGEQFRGTVVVEPRRVVDLRGIRLELVWIRADVHSADRVVAVSLPLCGPTRTAIGQRWTFPFELPLSPHLLPTSAARFSVLSWRVDLVADIPMQSDEVTRIPITLT